ncbi:phosphotransferase family protein [Desulfoplanes formicivorans]|uniref:Aminoglycoside phosphotransferase n=1 Tax=Desulfoplanes formicivorans TaxID=1592317 RepID=A0A194AKJ4_9BACT|nr:phosphotransferase [Desulfoplanes formicivorans]GAU09760.1 aminoglycoside phosphotransferase [Desulfoplanes formicivorans]
MSMIKRIHAYLNQSGWVKPPWDISFLASGEYHENYLVAAQGARYVFRINHGSQLGLADQVGYEFRVLKALANSGVTPRPYAVDPGPNVFGSGVLLMEYVPGVPLNYQTDLKKAAAIFARIHSQPVVAGLIRQDDPLSAIAEESLGLVHRYPDHPRTREKELILRYHGKILELVEHNRDLFANESPCIVNTEVNAGNFCMGPDRSYLVDWEKAVISSRYQDLGHFLVPTTTLWKTDHICTPEERHVFLEAYQAACDQALVLDELVFKTGMLMRTIALRATAWCFMAWYEYTRQDRGLRHQGTFERITSFLDNLEWIFNSVE